MAQVRVMRKVLASNDALARSQLETLDRHGVLGVNIMSGPGAGKTTLVERTVEKLLDRWRIYVIEGDIQSSLDADRVAARGAGVTQINTQGACHLDGMMMASVFPGIDFAQLDLLIIENVGNLVCPAEFTLPAHHNVTVISTPEGSDKPVKYPLMFSKSDLVVVNKTDLLPYVDFDTDALEAAVHKLKPGIPVLRMSAKTGEGLDAWTGWLEERLNERKGDG
ncbi:hydrogenase nickel incorporation protein HypB [candidate division WOR-3 bacterium]|nr:hydrogenase nickel incorporation protein HypB [candidate division WOR-3 bacterium]